jgi:hypothetical protein
MNPLLDVYPDLVMDSILFCHSPLEQEHCHSTMEDIEPENYQLSSTDSLSQDDAEALLYLLNEKNKEGPESALISTSREAPVHHMSISSNSTTSFESPKWEDPSHQLTKINNDVNDGEKSESSR